MFEHARLHQLLRLFSDLLVPDQVLDPVHAAILIMSQKNNVLQLWRTLERMAIANIGSKILLRDFPILQL
jgi:hypothetical protein